MTEEKTIKSEMTLVFATRLLEVAQVIITESCPLATPEKHKLTMLIEMAQDKSKELTSKVKEGHFI